jgi:hypothetical protein
VNALFITYVSLDIFAIKFSSSIIFWSADRKTSYVLNWLFYQKFEHVTLVIDQSEIISITQVANNLQYQGNVITLTADAISFAVEDFDNSDANQPTSVSDFRPREIYRTMM